MHLDLYSGCRSQNIRCEPETGDYLGIIIRQLWITKKKKKKSLTPRVGIDMRKYHFD